MNPETSPLSLLTLHADLTTIGFDNRFGNGKPKTDTSRMRGTRLIGPIKPIKNVRQFFRGNTNPSIMHLNDNIIQLPHRPHNDLPTLFGVTQGIPQQI